MGRGVSWWDDAYPYVLGAATTLVATVLVDVLRGRRERRHRFDAEKYRIYVDAIRACQETRKAARDFVEVMRRLEDIAIRADAMIEVASDGESSAPEWRQMLNELDGPKPDTTAIEVALAQAHETLTANEAALRVVAPRLVQYRFLKLVEQAEAGTTDADQFYKRLAACSDAMRRDLGTHRWIVGEVLAVLPHARKYLRDSDL